MLEQQKIEDMTVVRQVFGDEVRREDSMKGGKYRAHCSSSYTDTSEDDRE